MRAPGRPRPVRPWCEGQAGLVDLDQAGERLPPGIDHRPTQLRKAARPSCSCRARAAATAAGPRYRSCGSPSASGQEPEPERQVLRCGTVPAVTEVCRWHCPHWTSSRPRPSSQPLSWPQPGQRNPSGQRFSNSQRAQASIVAKLPSRRQRSRPFGPFHLPRTARPRARALCLCKRVSDSGNTKMILGRRSRDPSWAVLHCLRSLVGERVAVVLPTVVLLLALGHGAPARAHSAEGAETGAIPVAQLSTAPQGTEMFEHAPVPAADRGRARAGTVVGSVKLRADLRQARQGLAQRPERTANSARSRDGEGALRTGLQLPGPGKGRGRRARRHRRRDHRHGQGGQRRLRTAAAGRRLVDPGQARQGAEALCFPNKPEAPKQSIKPKADAAGADCGAKVKRPCCCTRPQQPVG